ncbi:hypothetical protein BpHYR1_006186 [Brachionus plicatilis]|uniref:Uncharacterized protein n=1 Tax=Brachionus plicatilis TaxID=10195 RepID=A0A3M7P2G2_BRAPC|nr:hypothetical protein BpHYR1_006186 [Brachionus plicatilis]
MLLTAIFYVENFIRTFKSDMNCLRSEIETDIQTFNAIKRSVMRLEEIFKRFSENKTKILDEITHNEIKTIVYNEIIGKIEEYEKVLEKRKYSDDIKEKFEKLTIPYKKSIATGFGLFGAMGIGAFIKLINSNNISISLDESGKKGITKTLATNGTDFWKYGIFCVVLGGLGCGFTTLFKLQELDEDIEKEKDNFFTKYKDDFSSLLMNLSNFCRGFSPLLGEVKEFCGRIFQNNEVLIKIIEDHKIWIVSLSHTTFSTREKYIFFASRNIKKTNYN